MVRLTTEIVCRDEIKYAERHAPVACAMGVLRKKDHLTFGELHRTVVGCVGKKITQKRFKQYVRGMIENGLILETFSIEQKFRFVLSPIGEDIYKIMEKTDDHLIEVDHP